MDCQNFSLFKDSTNTPQITTTPVLPKRVSILRQSSVEYKPRKYSNGEDENQMSTKRHVHFGFLEEILFNEIEEENNNKNDENSENISKIKRRTSSLQNLSTDCLTERKPRSKSFMEEKTKNKTDLTKTKNKTDLTNSKRSINVLRFCWGAKSVLESLSGLGHLRQHPNISVK